MYGRPKGPILIKESKQTMIEINKDSEIDMKIMQK